MYMKTFLINSTIMPADILEPHRDSVLSSTDDRHSGQTYLRQNFLDADIAPWDFMIAVISIRFLSMGAI